LSSLNLHAPPGVSCYFLVTLNDTSRRLNEEAVDFVNGLAISGSSLPLRLHLQHSKVPIDELAAAQWDNRATKLGELMASDAWLWGTFPNANLEHGRLLRWMKSPSPEGLVRNKVAGGLGFEPRLVESESAVPAPD
jgi:hypothetical protein